MAVQVVDFVLVIGRPTTGLETAIFTEQTVVSMVHLLTVNML